MVDASILKKKVRAWKNKQKQIEKNLKMLKKKGAKAGVQKLTKSLKKAKSELAKAEKVLAKVSPKKKAPAKKKKATKKKKKK